MRRSFRIASVVLGACAGLLGGCELVAGVGDLRERDDQDLHDSAAGDDPTSGETGADARSDAKSLDDAADGGVLPPSCKTGAVGVTSCAGDLGCCTSPIVAGGTFFRTYTVDFQGPRDTADPATISAFRLDKYEVTVGRFRNFVKAITAADGAPPPEGAGKHSHLNGGKGLVNDEAADAGDKFEHGWDSTKWNFGLPSGPGSTATWSSNFSMNSTWTSGNDALPIAGVTWFEAMAFCIWDGGFLASDAELEYAMAGGDGQRQYPWGSVEPTHDCPGGCDYAISNCVYPTPPDASSCGLQSIAAVGMASKGAGRWGQVDLFGNVAEWVLDRANEDIDTPQRSPCTDCANTDTDVERGNGRFVRGGDWRTGLPSVDSRFINAPTSRTALSQLGFRCARPPVP